MYNYNEMPEIPSFHQLEIEKVCRISTMLEKMMDIPFLKDRLSLIGGTAINFIYTKPLARLSVDLDFNFTQKITGQLKENEIKMIETFYTQSRFNPELIDDDGIFNEGLKDHPIIKWKHLKSNRK